MNKAIIFLNGSLEKSKNISSYINKEDLIICANGGTKNALKLNLIPNVIIGDLDSLKPSLKPKLKKYDIEYIKYSCNKDKTDSELALEYAIKKNFKNIYIFGALGERLDHFIANLYLLANTKFRKLNLKIIYKNQEIFLIQNKRTILGKKGDLLSLIPFKENCIGITTKGLKYRLQKEALYFGSSRGISNVFTSSKAEIKIKKGILLAIHLKI